MDLHLLKMYKKYQKKAGCKSLKPNEIKAIRKSYNLLQLGFAKMLKISVKTLQNYEIGRTIPPSTATALFILAKEHPKLFHQYRDSKSIPFMY